VSPPAAAEAGAGQRGGRVTAALLPPVARPERATGSRVVAVVGTGRSGSTLLALLLGTSPEIATVGELTGPPPGADGTRSRCSCGRTLGACPFWAALSAAAAARGTAFGPARWDLRFEVPGGRLRRRLLVRSLRARALDRVRDRLVLASPAGARLREVAARNVAVVDAVLAVTGRRVLADVSKDPVRVRWLAALTDLDLRVVHLVRDPLGFAGSQVRLGVPVARAVRQWRRSAAAVGRLLEELPEGRARRVRYEDLCRDPVRELDRIAALAGVAPFDPAAVAAHAAAEHHVIGNRMRLAVTGAVTLDESWRERLTPRDIDLVLRRTAPQRTALGYA